MSKTLSDCTKCGELLSENHGATRDQRCPECNAEGVPIVPIFRVLYDSDFGSVEHYGPPMASVTATVAQIDGKTEWDRALAACKANPTPENFERLEEAHYEALADAAY